MGLRAGQEESTHCLLSYLCQGPVSSTPGGIHLTGRHSPVWVACPRKGSVSFPISQDPSCQLYCSVLAILYPRIKVCFVLDSCHNCSPSQQICDNLQLLTLSRVEGLAEWLSTAVRMPGNDMWGPFYSSRALESCSREKENASIPQALLPQLPEADAPAALTVWVPP